jgi:hypothetical protein
VAISLLIKCTVIKDSYGTYENSCVLYDRLPAVTLVLKSDNTFSYKFPYVDDRIEGIWRISKDSLILRSDYFLKENEPLTPKRKYTDVPGEDIYLIRGTKLYAVSSNGMKRECYLKKVRK